MRQAKSLSQEEMAEKLGLSINGYANIERGDTDVGSLRIKQIAEALDADFMELVSFGERNVVFLTGSGNYNFSHISHDTTVSNDLEKAHLIIDAQRSEIAHLKEIIELMKALNPRPST